MTARILLLLAIPVAFVVVLGCTPAEAPPADPPPVDADSPDGPPIAAPPEDRKPSWTATISSPSTCTRNWPRKRGNIVFSPYSISSALAMTYAGARGQTAEEMAKVLHFTLPPERLHPAFWWDYPVACG